MNEGVLRVKYDGAGTSLAYEVDVRRAKDKTWSGTAGPHAVQGERTRPAVIAALAKLMLGELVRRAKGEVN